MKVLITGCNGQVGHCLVEQLHGKAEVLALDVNKLDITDKEQVFNTVLEFKPDFIMNAAAHTAVDKAEEEEALSYRINRDGPLFLAQAAKDIDACLLHISTDYVFEGNKVDTYTEDDTTNPQGVYGASKLAGEIAVQENSPKYIIIRTAWVFGEHGNNFIKTMLRLGRDRDALSIVGDQFGGPTYAGDIAQALISIANQIQNGSTDWGIYHFSGEPHVSWFDFAQAIFKQAEDKKILDKAPSLTSITTSEFPTAAKRPQNSTLDCSKIKDVFGVESSNWKVALNRIEEYL
ncbi:dTDP-4-dehydrorhamnose reductase [Vibrio hibernica]|uniref:dTDP-4-dehydrorhamnose reductase n=1 Tax=Vibrio hibernica TaxID=2587465 RepID=UPI001880C639|nr:dTDP-4-dehydrorhamnose reductase [Vibrio hibernica]